MQLYQHLEADRQVNGALSSTCGLAVWKGNAANCSIRLGVHMEKRCALCEIDERQGAVPNEARHYFIAYAATTSTLLLTRLCHTRRLRGRVPLRGLRRCRHA